MTTKTIAVLVGVVAAVLAASVLLDLARRSITVLVVAGIAFAAGWMTGSVRRRSARRPARGDRGPGPWPERWEEQ